jgi:hypothetical protein
VTDIPHLPMQIGTRDAEGYRTFSTPGDVCSTCSDEQAGRWVPVTDCPVALAMHDELWAWIAYDGDEPEWHVQMTAGWRELAGG